jgi:hypothetical protein
VEIWDYLNGTFLTFTPPKFIRFFNLNAPSVAGTYNFTVFVADHTNAAAYPEQCQNSNPPANFCSFPDFVHAWNTTLFVPVSMRDTPASISGTICDVWYSPMCPPIVGTKGIAYAQTSSGTIAARSYVNQTTGQFNLTGLAPGNYQILASAGFDVMTDSAYSLSSYCPQANPYCVIVGAGGRTSIGSLQLYRAPQVCGSIVYRGPSGLPLAHSLSDNPYLTAIGLTVLNITVEAIDSQNNVYRNITLSMDSSSDSFSLIMGSNVTYVGTNPYGTEFAGLPPPVNGPYQLTLNVWISGYVQITPETVTVSASPLPGSTTACNSVSTSPVVMQVGGAISGTIQFWNQQGLETPHQAEASLSLSNATDALFGGNVLIEAFDHTGILRAVSVINGTYANGTTIYRNSVSIPFFLIGFNEYLNHTWSGTWEEHDSGLPADSGYTIQVFIRGYELQTFTSIPLSLGASVNNLQLKMLRGGAFQVGVFSYDNRMGTRAVQAPFPWLFLYLGIPVRARIYFYDSAARTVGWVECVIRIGIIQPDPLCSNSLGPEKNSLTVIFAGQNWNMREIWFFGDIPTHITNDNYTIKTYTLGYVWQYGPITAPNNLLGFSQVSVTLLIGDEIDITGPIFLNPQLLGTLPENDYAIGQVFEQLTGFAGAVPANLTAGTPTLGFTIFGFGGMTNSTVPFYPLTSGQSANLNGQGHFFYVGTDGTRYFDYGLDNMTQYTAQVPEFGFNQHFMEIVPPTQITFTDLFLEIGIVRSQLAMAVVTSSAVIGWVSSANPPFDVAPLSWVMVTASNATFERTVVTLDGGFGGPGALELPQGFYNITFSVAFFQPQTLSNLFVQWDGGYPVSPPNGPLCPTAGSPYACDPPRSNSQPNLENDGVPPQNGHHERGRASSAVDPFLHAWVCGDALSVLTEFTAVTESPVSDTNQSTRGRVRGLENRNATWLFAQVESRGRYYRSLFSRLALCPRRIVYDPEYMKRPLLD